MKTSRQRGFRPWIRVQKQPQVRKMCAKISCSIRRSSGRLIAAPTVWVVQSAGAWGASPVQRGTIRAHRSCAASSVTGDYDTGGRPLAVCCTSPQRGRHWRRSASADSPCNIIFNLYCKYSVNRLQLYQLYGIIIGSICAAYRHIKIQPQ